MRLIVSVLALLLGGGVVGAVLLSDPNRVEVPSEPAPPDRPEPDQTTCQAISRPALKTRDVSQFDIGGLKLGMTQEDTQKIMDCTHAIERNISMKECAADLIAYDQQWREARKRGVVNTRVVERNCLASLSWREQDRRVTVNFVEDLPDHPGRMLIYQVSTEQDGAVNEASLQIFRKALIGKYGLPTSDSKTDLIWGKYPDPQLRFFPYAQYYLDLVHRGGKAERDRSLLKFVGDSAPTVEPHL
ncbi:hypothetical protein [Methylobacterium sp. J-070]|uniref:hypothetical protein n=1 Tax=Methylobacterium sp. J-070 TaxID=2836650 RepID=UPI001FB90F1F|nr:hypothetical protein [Methylobacterium sp. J-070]MCJ2053855.1 hypothetical protein [Methylobacterium sp. J-070]